MVFRTTLLLNGILYGLGAAIPIGPVNVEMGRRTLLGGFTAGAAIGCGAVTVDVSYALLYSLGVARFTTHPIIYWPMVVAGVSILALLGILSIRGAREAGRDDPLRTPGNRRGSFHGGYVTGLLMTSTNPMTVAFWFTALPAYTGKITAQPRHDLPIICLGVLIGALAWVAFYAGTLSLAGKFRKRWWMTAADEAGGVMLLGLAGIALLRAIEGLL